MKSLHTVTVLVAILLLVVPAAAQAGALDLHTVEGIDPETFPSRPLPAGSLGIVNGDLLRGEGAHPWAELLPAVGWQVVNLSWRDLEAWPAGVEALRRAPKVTVLAANLRHQGRPVGKACHRLQRGGRRVALIGVTRPPAGRTLPPAAKGLELVDPERALAGILPGLKADLVVVVAAMTREQTAALAAKVEGVHLWIASGRGSGDPTPLTPAGSRLLVSPSGGDRWGWIRVGAEGAVRHDFIRPQGPRSESLDAARRNLNLGTVPRADLLLPKPPPLPPARDIPLATANRACHLVVRGLVRRDRYGSLRPEAGGRLLVVDLEAENIMPLTLVRGLKIPTAYRIPNLADHLYLVVDGSRLSRLHPDRGDLPGHLPVRNFNLPRLGDRRRGNLVFPIPDKGKPHLELRFYDYAHGHMVLDLTPERARPEAKATVPVQANRFLEMGVYGLTRGTPAQGMVPLDIDLRGCSLFRIDGDATAFDPKAKAGQRLPVGTVADWQESRRHLQVVVDGLWSFSPLAGSALPTAPRFLPDLPTGNVVRFLVPAQTTSLELRCAFPNAKASGSAELYRPRPLRFTLAGQPAPPAKVPALATVDDKVFTVRVTGQRVYGSYGDRPAGKEEKFLRLEVRVTNIGTQDEFFQPRRQVAYLTEGGRQREFDPISLAGPRPAAELLLIPAGETRGFHAVYRIPAKDKRPRVAYRGISLARTLTLPGLDDKPLAEGPKVAPLPTPKRPGTRVKRTSHALTGSPVPGFRPCTARTGEVELALLGLRLSSTCRGHRLDDGHHYVHLQVRWTRLATKGTEAGKAPAPWRSGNLQERLFHYRRPGTGRRIRSGHMDYEGFLPSRVRLTRVGQTLTGNLAFAIKGELEPGDSLVYARPDGGHLELPLRPAPTGGPAAKVIASAENEHLRLEVVGLTDLTDKVERPGAREAWRENRIMGLCLRYTAKRYLLRLPPPRAWLQVMAGGELPCRHLDPDGVAPGGLPWLVRDGYWPGDRSGRGVLAFSLPDPRAGLELVCHFPSLGRPDHTAVQPSPLRLVLRRGTTRALPPSLGTLTGARLTASILGIRTNGKATRRPLVVVDTVVRLAPGAKAFTLDPSRAFRVQDQSGNALDLVYYPTRFSPMKRFHLEAGRARRFDLTVSLGSPGARLWLHLAGAREAVVLPNPWVPEESSKPTDLVRVPLAKGARPPHPFYTPPPLRPEPEPRGIAGVGLKARQVNEAIRRGALALMAIVAQEGGFGTVDRRHSLAALALLHTEEFDNHPKVKAACLDYLVARKLDSVYDAAITAMALAAVDPVRYRPRIRRIAQLLVDCQSKGGGWEYISKQARLVPPEKSLLAKPTGPVQVTGGEPIPRWPGTPSVPDIDLKPTRPLYLHSGDNSCSQYAVLGLHAAVGAGVRPPRSTWELARKWFLEGHNRGCGWGYGQRSTTTGSMTTAGLAGLAITAYHLGETPPTVEGALRCGVDWLGRHFALERNPVDAGHHYYYLYGLERAGRLLGKHHLGFREWYPLGARFLVAQQHADGRWLGSTNEDYLLDTSYALLFLTKATEELTRDRKAKTGPGWLQVRSAGLGGTVAFILDASGSMLARLGDGQETRFQVAKRVLKQVLKGSGKRLRVSLRAYGHRYRAIDKRAHQDSERLVDFGPPDRPELMKTLDRIRCRGKTPLTYSLRATLEDLADAEGDNKRIVLLTDGNESDRKARPLEAAAAAKAAGVRLDLVCLAVADARRLQRMAAAGGGTCWSAATAEQLLKAVRTAMLGVVPFQVLDRQGKPVARGNSGDKVQLAAGPYKVRVDLPGGAVTTDLWVHQDRTTTVTVRPTGG